MLSFGLVGVGIVGFRLGLGPPVSIFAVLSCRVLAVFLVLFGILLAMRRGVCLEWVLG